MEELNLVYECVNCSELVFSCYKYKERTLVCEFAAGVEEEFLVFEQAYDVFVCSESATHNGNTFFEVTCGCERELGYYVPVLRAAGIPKWPLELFCGRTCLTDVFCVRGERVRLRPNTREVKLMEFVESRASYALSRWENQLSADPRMAMAIAADAASEVARHVEDSFDR